MISTPTDGTPALQPQLDVALTVAHRDVEVRFSVDSGNTLALVGPNGSGKTTTLQALAGWLRPDSGYARLDQTVLFDCPVPHQPPAVWLPPAQRGIGHLSQEPGLFPHLTAQENIAYGMDRAGFSRRTARLEAAQAWLERVGLAGCGDRKPAQLSGGQAQRVAIARVLASGPRLVLLDEPLAALDRNAAPALRELLAEVLREQTVLLVTHHQDDVEALANDVYHIDADVSPWE